VVKAAVLPIHSLSLYIGGYMYKPLARDAGGGGGGGGGAGEEGGG